MMNPDVLSRLSALTREEELLLGGAPLNRDAYSSDPSFLVQSEKMLPPRPLQESYWGNIIRPIIMMNPPF